jgi:hypothetical protein
MSGTDDAVPEDGGTGLSTLMGPTSDLADDGPKWRIDRVLRWVPRVLSSKPHVVLLMGLGGHLVVAAIGPGDGQPPLGSRERPQPDGDGG